MINYVEVLLRNLQAKVFLALHLSLTTLILIGEITKTISTIHIPLYLFRQASTPIQLPVLECVEHKDNCYLNLQNFLRETIFILRLLHIPFK